VRKHPVLEQCPHCGRKHQYACLNPRTCPKCGHIANRPKTHCNCLRCAPMLPGIEEHLRKEGRRG
jgi:hypothetical protein